MPFISEELWQRLPRRQGDMTPTVMLAPYPVFDTSLDFPADALNYELGLRSVTFSYSIFSPSLFSFFLSLCPV
jgi:valyl-tRNA synthetase